MKNKLFLFTLIILICGVVFYAPKANAGSCEGHWVKNVTPNGGQQYMEGSGITVKWETCEAANADKIQIKIFQVDANMHFIGNESALVWHTQNDWQECVTLPQVDQTGLYVIGVKDLNNGKIAMSDNYFTILSNEFAGQLTVTTHPATNVSQTSARLNTYYDGYYVSPGADVWFEYGPTPAFGYQSGDKGWTDGHGSGDGASCGNGGGNGMHEAGSWDMLIWDLLPNTTYYYRAVGQYNGYPATYGETLSFTTLP